MADYIRTASGWRFENGGLNLRDSPDAIPPNQYSSLQNARGYAKLGIRARPGYTPFFSCGNAAITDMKAYAAIETDDQPRWIARDASNILYLDTGNNVTTMAGNSANGVSMVPFRPSASPQTWMYVASEGAYIKLSAPNSSNVVTVQKAGIPEPQVALVFAPLSLDYTNFTNSVGNWTAGGTAGNLNSVSRSNDTIAAVFPDPAQSNRVSAQVGNNVQYQIGEITSQGVIQDVLPAIPSGLSVQAIRYNSGNTGTCTIVPSQLPIGTEIPGAISAGFLRRGALVNVGNEVCFVRSVTDGPGGLVSFDTSTNNPHGANASIAGVSAIIIDNATTGSLTATAFSGNVTAGVGTYSQNLSASPFGTQLGSSGIFPQEDDYVHISILVSNPVQIIEMKIIFNVDSSDTSYQRNAYYYAVSPAVLASVVTGASTQSDAVLASGEPVSSANANITELQSEITSLQNEIANPGIAYEAVPELQTALQSLQSQLLDLQGQVQAGPVQPPGSTTSGSSQWSEIIFPISSLTRIGNDQTRTLVNTNGVQLYVNVESVTATWVASTYYPVGFQVVDPNGHIQQVTGAGVSGTTQPTWNDSGGTTSDGSITWQDEGVNANSLNIEISSLWVGGGGQPDVGDDGADYSYRCVPRASTTGVQGNPSPVPRYGIRPRRQNAIVKTSLLSATDPQQDTWDIYRYGGSVTSWQYLGSVAVGSDWTDTYFDDAVDVNRPLITDNFEPWPSVDVPFSQSSGINVVGQWITLTGMTPPATIAKWLPGTLIVLGGLQTFTLYARPVELSSSSYLFQIQECAGFGSPAGFLVQEPIVANAIQQSVWGPDSLGVLFGVMDQLRPGTISWAKANTPDQVSSLNNQDLCPPSEPLLGGAVRSGVSLASSSKRWWALYPDFSTPGAYNAIEAPVGRALITPWGHITDGSTVWFWARDGICSTDGGPYKSLTYKELYPLFPHEGVNQGINIVRSGVTYYAPDYSRASTFRLGLANGYLFAGYQDTTGTWRVLTFCIETGAWVKDLYHDQITSLWGLEQQPGTLLSSNNSVYASLLLASANGHVFKSTDLTDDNNNSIPVVVATFQWDGGDIRAAYDYGDAYLDAHPYVAITVQPITQQGNIANNTVIAANNNRQFAPVSLGGITSQQFVGLQITWSETFANNNVTQLHNWDIAVLPRPEQIRDRYGDWIGSLRG